MKQLVSTVIASYNHAEHIEACLYSIYEQNYDRVEVVLVDDASKDDTYSIASAILTRPQFARRFVNIRCLLNPRNFGAHYTLNAGARTATGSIVSFMNSDDYYHPDRLAGLLQTYAGEDHWIAFSNVQAVNEAGTSIYGGLAEAVRHDAARWIYRTGRASSALLARQITSSTGNIAVSKSLFDAAGGFRDLRYCHDWDFMLRCAFFAEPVFVPSVYYYYRIHGSNSFSSLASVAENETREVLEGHFRRLLCSEPKNTLMLCPQRNPAYFWIVVDECGARSHAERAAFPYNRSTRTVDIGRRK